MNEPPSSLLERLAVWLEHHGVPYMVIGGQAVLVHGEPRTTRDVDVTVGVAPSELSRILQVADDVGLRPLVEDVDSFVQETWVLPTLDPATGFRVDFVFSASDYEAVAIERAVRVPIGKGSLRVASAVDLVVHKVLAGRPRDLEDVLGVLRRQPELDVSEVRRWLSELEAIAEQPLVDRFEALLEQVRREMEG